MLTVSYQLPYRVHTAKGYPVLAPNGSSIVVYGNDNGIKVVWRGGRHFASREKPAPKVENPNGKPNGANDDAIMIIDSDEESPQESPKEDSPSYEFDTEEPEVDPEYPFEEIRRQIDVPFGSSVLGLAVPRVRPESARSSLEQFPPVLTKMIVVSAVCADYSTRVVALPLLPPHPTQTDPATWQIQSLKVNGVSHQEIPRGVSITFTGQESEEEQELGRSRRRSTSRVDARGAGWDLLVATHSAEASGLLMTHRIPILNGAAGSEYHLSDNIESRRRYLPSPVKSIAFNPSSYPSARHSTLLVAFHSGCVKIYSCFSVKPSRASRRSSGVQSEYETTETEGKWLISLYPGFEQSPSKLGGRKAVVDADWVLGGRAVMVLLADGEWGVWDVEGAGPGSAKGPLQHQSSIQGVSGGSLTKYSVSGRILNPISDTVGTDSAPRHKFAPTTPSTKRVREDTLLKGPSSPSTASLRGEISVFQTNSARDPLPDESILLQHGPQTVIIPSLLSFWRNAVRSTGTFDSSYRCKPTALREIKLMGENARGIGHIPAASRQSRDTGRTEFDILITAEHRLIILAPRLTEPERPDFKPSASGQTSAENDQVMLQQGELDVDGMDRVLNGMANRSQSARMKSPVKQARIFS